MKNKRNMRPIIWWAGLYLIMILFFSCPTSLSAEKQNCYYVLCFQVLIIWLIFIVTSNKYGIDLIEPIGLVTVIHVLLFEITPIICLFTDEIEWFELDLWGGCIKGSWLSTLGFGCLVFSYYNSRNRWNDLNNNCYDENDGIEGNYSNCFYLNMIIWFLAFCANVYLIMTSGKSLSYIITLGIGSTTENAGVVANVGFLGVLAYAMIPAFLYIFVLSNSRLLKLVLFYLTVVTFMVRGFRFILIAVILAPVIIVCLTKDKRPKVWQIVVIVYVLLFMSGFLGVMRGSLRSGSGMEGFSLSMITGELIYDIVIENFEIFKTYYGMIENIPSAMGYTMGQQMILYTLIMMIPRAIWPGKPQPILRRVISISVSGYASIAGTAYPYVGEFYHEFGIVGIIAFCLIFGKLLNRLKGCMYRRDIHSRVLYSSILPLLFQILIRGYTPSNFYMILFVCIPVFLSKNVIRE